MFIFVALPRTAYQVLAQFRFLKDRQSPRSKKCSKKMATNFRDPSCFRHQGFGIFSPPELGDFRANQIGSLREGPVKNAAGSFELSLGYPKGDGREKDEERGADL